MLKTSPTAKPFTPSQLSQMCPGTFMTTTTIELHLQLHTHRSIRFLQIWTLLHQIKSSLFSVLFCSQLSLKRHCNGKSDWSLVSQQSISTCVQVDGYLFQRYSETRLIERRFDLEQALVGAVLIRDCFQTPCLWFCYECTNLFSQYRSVQKSILCHKISLWSHVKWAPMAILHASSITTDFRLIDLHAKSALRMTSTSVLGSHHLKHIQPISWQTHHQTPASAHLSLITRLRTKLLSNKTLCAWDMVNG